MFEDARPCQVCGAPVRLEAHAPDDDAGQRPVGPADGVVGGADPTLDERICTNDDCPTRRGEGEA